VAEASQLVRRASWCLFVDGENFTKRGQEMLREADVKPIPGSHWRRDVYLWLPSWGATRAWFSWWGRDEGPDRAIRAYYYTSMPTGEPEWTDAQLALRELGFEPRLFPRRRGRSKAVDIALTTDVLTLAAEGRYEVAVLFAGDGDYVPLVEAVKRAGQHVVVGFFEGYGLSPQLRIAADEFVDLSGSITSAWRQRHTEEEREKARAAVQAASEGGA